MWFSTSKALHNINGKLTVEWWIWKNLEVFMS